MALLGVTIAGASGTAAVGATVVGAGVGVAVGVGAGVGVAGSTVGVAGSTAGSCNILESMWCSSDIPLPHEANRSAPRIANGKLRIVFILIGMREEYVEGKNSLTK
jgi:hypothetical protein